MRSVAILIDGSNMSAALKAAGYRCDYNKIREFFNTDTSRLAYAGYFTALNPRVEGEIDNIRNLTDYLQYNGWTLITKETKRFADKVKGNMDVELAVMAMKLAFTGRITDIILFTGDGDFCSLVKALKEETIRVTAVSYYDKSEKCVISDDLRREVDEFLNMADPQVRKLFMSDQPNRVPFLRRPA